MIVIFPWCLLTPNTYANKMDFEIPEELRYQESHEWIEDGDPACVGISDFAQDELGDVVFVELPDEGDHLDQGDDFAVIESIKAVSDVYTPISGEVVSVNSQLLDQPELINEDPYGDGWLIGIEITDESELEDLLTPDEYAEQIE